MTPSAAGIPDHDLATAFSKLGRRRALAKASDILRDAGIETASLDARLLLLDAENCDHAALIRDPDHLLSPEGERRLQDMLRRRLSGEPTTRIVGHRAFWTLDLLVTPDVLDPRPDSECLVSSAMDRLGPARDAPLRILDLGTGSGALLLALVAECPLAFGVGLDLSPRACAVAKANAERNGLAGRVEIRQGSWTSSLEGAFDVVVSNPPYIETAALAGLDVAVRDHDPALALDGGADGLTAYRDIMAVLPALMGGFAVLEVGQGQAPAVRKLAERVGLVQLELRRDLGGIPRALTLGRP